MPYAKPILLALLGGAALFAQSTITCSSDDMMRHYCGADTRGGVRLMRQRSDAACREGSTWGYDRRGIWVDRGCRADFQTGFGSGAYNGGYPNGGYPNGGYPNGGYSNGGYSNGGYSNGGYSNGGYGPYANSGYGQTFYCASDDMRRHYCSVDTRGGVQIVRQRSDATCRMGSTWGYDRRGVWVDRGCRADFAVNTGYNSGGSNRGYGRDRDYRDRDRYNDPYYRDRDRDRYRRW